MLPFTIELARAAGALIRDMAAQPRQVTHKGPTDLVTDVDRASEALILESIHKQFPDHAILSEETGGREADSPWLWVVDPLDGTNNFAHGFPFYCVSLGLLHHGEPFIGVVYDPVRDEVFAGERGKGATRNGTPMHVSQTPTLQLAMLSTGFPYDYATNPVNNAAEFTRVHTYAQGVRRAGAAALDLASVACGRLDGHWEFWLKPWDAAAGALLLLEAGGRISDRNGDAWTPWSTSMVATNGNIHTSLIEHVHTR